MQFKDELYKLLKKFSLFYPKKTVSSYIYDLNNEMCVTINILNTFRNLLSEKYKNDNVNKKNYMKNKINEISELDLDVNNNKFKILKKKYHDLDISILISHYYETNYIPFFIKNFYFYVRYIINENNEKYWSLELHNVNKDVSKMWQEEILELKKDKLDTLNSKKLHKMTLKRKLKILNKILSKDIVKIIKSYVWISTNKYFSKNKNFSQLFLYDINDINELQLDELQWKFDPYYGPTD
jgi:hypothetical protein